MFIMKTELLLLPVLYYVAILLQNSRIASECKRALSFTSSSAPCSFLSVLPLTPRVYFRIGLHLLVILEVVRSIPDLS